MIRINLLKPLQVPDAPIMLMEEPKGKRKQLIFVIAGLALLAAGASVFLQYPTFVSGLFGGGSAHEAEKLTDVASKPEEPKQQAMPKKVTADAVEEIVRENPEQKQGPSASYADLVPSEKIEYQYFVATRILQDVKSVTPPDVGFANFIFTPPGEFYVHGLAYDQETLKRFQDGLSGLRGASIRPGLSAKAGARGTAREFSFYGTIKYPLNSIPQPPDRVVTKQQLPGELKHFQQTASTLGIRLPNPKLMSTTSAGSYSKMVFQASANCSYQQIQDLITQLHQSNSNLGFLKFALRAEGDEHIVASLDILAYVN